jgi:hypothetical protein
MATKLKKPKTTKDKEAATKAVFTALISKASKPLKPKKKTKV